MPLITSIQELINRYSHINWALADQAVVSGSNFVTNILLARYLGLEAFGIFTLIWMSVQFINGIQFSLVSAPMMSIAPKLKIGEKPAYYGASVVQQLGITAATSLLLNTGVISSDLLFPHWDMILYLWPLTMASLTFQLQDFIRRYLFTQGRHTDAFINDSISYVGQIAALLCLAMLFGITVTNVLWAIAATSSLAIVHGVLTAGSMQYNRATLSRSIKRNWKFSKWLTGASIIQWLSGNLFIVAAGSILGPHVVGALKASQNIVGITHIFFQVLENIVPIKAAHHYGNSGIHSMNHYLKKITLVAGTPIIILLLIAAAFPAFWLNLVYGTEYTETAKVLQWYAVIYIVIFFGVPFRSALRALEDTKPILIANIFSALFAFTCAMPIVTHFKLAGTISGILISNLILVTTLFIAYRSASQKKIKHAT